MFPAQNQPQKILFRRNRKTPKRPTKPVRWGHYVLDPRCSLLYRVEPVTVRDVVDRAPDFREAGSWSAHRNAFHHRLLLDRPKIFINTSNAAVK